VARVGRRSTPSCVTCSEPDSTLRVRRRHARDQPVDLFDSTASIRSATVSRSTLRSATPDRSCPGRRSPVRRFRAVLEYLHTGGTAAGAHRPVRRYRRARLLHRACSTVSTAKVSAPALLPELLAAPPTPITVAPDLAGALACLPLDRRLHARHERPAARCPVLAAPRPRAREAEIVEPPEQDGSARS
jgi:hypothetical protein